MAKKDEIQVEDVTVEEAPAKAPEKAKPEAPKPEETQRMQAWKFRYRQPRYCLPARVSEAAGSDPLIERGALVVRNWRIDLDMNVPAQRIIHEYLLSSDRRKVDFWQEADVDHTTDDVLNRVTTYKQVKGMSMAQLRVQMTAEEWQELGINPGTADRDILELGIVDSKKLT